MQSYTWDRCMCALLAVLCVITAVASLPSDFCPRSDSDKRTEGADFTTLCQSQPVAGTGPIAAVQCMHPGCRCSLQAAEMRCVPYNTTVSSMESGVEVTSSVSVACVCAFPQPA